MTGRAKTKGLFLVAALLSATLTSSAGADRTLQVPFEFATGRDSILLYVRINDQPALLALDTRSMMTSISPDFLLPGRGAAGAAESGSDSRYSGDGVSAEVSLQIGTWKWEKRRVVIKDLSSALAVYREQVNGVLGLDFLKQFEEMTINLRNKTVTFVAASDSPLRVLSPSIGGLRKLTLSHANAGDYRLNGVDLAQVPSDQIQFETDDHVYRVRVTFCKTVGIANGQAADESDNALLNSWADAIPLVRETLNKHDAIASMKLVLYDVVAPQKPTGLEFQEEVVTLRNMNPADPSKDNEAKLPPAIPFSKQIVDVQYRGLAKRQKQLFQKAVLQILFLKSTHQVMVLGGFLIVSTPRGEFDFYLIPHDLLNEIVVATK